METTLLIPFLLGSRWEGMGSVEVCGWSGLAGLGWAGLGWVGLAAEHGFMAAL